VVACSSIACRPARESKQTARNLVLVTIDTLRADHVGAYGNKDVETPRLDRIARQGAMARQATAHVPLTRPSHVSLFTGCLPPQTGVRDNISPALLPSTPLLAEVLKSAGFSTGAFVSSVILDTSSGLNRGFDAYSATFAGDASQPPFLSAVQRRGDATTREAVSWLEHWAGSSSATSRFFLWLHLYDPHDPYEPPEPYATRYAGHPYDGEVAWSDELVGRLDDALGRFGRSGDSVLIVTADHGEGLGEHGETLHGFFTYQTTLRIPFLARGPGIPAGTRIAPTVRLVDVFPTALDLLGVPLPAGARLAGTSLAGVLRGEVQGEEPLVYAESLVPLMHFGWSDLRVVRRGRWKYIEAPRPELYDLDQDPGEHTNVVASQRSRAEALKGALARFLEDERKGPLAEGARSVPIELLEKLGALGYVGEGGPAETFTPGADPKDKIDEFRVANDRIREGLLRLHDKEYSASAERFRAVLDSGVSSFEVHFYLARALDGLHRPREAAPHYEEAVRRSPAFAAAWQGLADSLVAAGRPEAALEALERGQKALSTDGKLALAKARLLVALERKVEARQAYEASLPLLPGDCTPRMELGELLRGMGEIEAAIERLREAVRLNPEQASYWNSLGMTLGGNGRLAEAEAAFREAVKRDEGNDRYNYNLGLILLREGHPDDAREFFQRSVTSNPSFAPARDQLNALRGGARR
jgi:arylsulfatase A-like enzyme/Flp pilus assembly protein TadD